MPQRILRVLVIAGASLALSAHAAPQPLSPAPSAAARAHVGFHASLSDREVVSEVARYGLKVRSARLWSHGLSGSFRSPTPVTPAELVRDARASSESFFQDAIAANTRRVNHFLGMYTEDDVVSRDDVQTRVRSLLNLREQLKAARRAAREGHPLIYGVEAEGSDVQIEAARRSRAVRVLDIDPRADSTADRRQRLELRPEQYRAEYQDPAVQQASPRALYTMLVIAGSGQ